MRRLRRAHEAGPPRFSAPSNTSGKRFRGSLFWKHVPGREASEDWGPCTQPLQRGGARGREGAAGRGRRTPGVGEKGPPRLSPVHAPGTAAWSSGRGRHGDATNTRPNGAGERTRPSHGVTRSSVGGGTNCLNREAPCSGAPVPLSGAGGSKRLSMSPHSPAGSSEAAARSSPSARGPGEAAESREAGAGGRQAGSHIANVNVALGWGGRAGGSACLQLGRGAGKRGHSLWKPAGDSDTYREADPGRRHLAGAAERGCGDASASRGGCSLVKGPQWARQPHSPGEQGAAHADFREGQRPHRWVLLGLTTCSLLGKVVRWCVCLGRGHRDPHLPMRPS